MNKFCRTLLGMVYLTVAVAGALAQKTAATNEVPSDNLLFRNGDFLYGQLLAINAQSGVRWRHPDSADVIEFKPDSIAQVSFPIATNAPEHPEDTCRVLLTNGDSLEGALVSCDRNSIVLDTWYAGRINIARDALQTLAFTPRSPAIFAGITGLDGWTQAVAAASNPIIDTGRWIYRSGAFYADKSASIARDLQLPDVAEIQFDLAWKGMLNLAVALYTDSLQPVLLGAKDQAPDFGGFYSFRLQNSLSFSVDLWGIKKAAPIRYLGNLFVPTFNNKDRVHVDLRVDKPRHKIALFLDDTLAKEWDDTEGFMGDGHDIRFVQNQGGVLKLSNLRVTQWDGILDQASAESPDPAHDIIWPESRAKIIGDIESISAGKLTARATNGLVEIPLDKLKAIDFARRQTESAAPFTNSMRATFTQGGVLTFLLESWQPGEMLIRSPDFGKIKINPAAFSRLQFLPTDKKATEGPNG